MASLQALGALHYVCPITVVFFFTSANILRRCCTISKDTLSSSPSPKSQNLVQKQLSNLLHGLLIATTLGYFAELVYAIILSVQTNTSVLRNDYIFFIGFMAFVYFGFSIQTPSSLWLELCAPALITIAFEITIIILSFETRDTNNSMSSPKTFAVFCLYRILTLLAVISVVGVISLQARKPGKDEENEPLLGNNSNGTAANGNAYGATEAAGEETERDKKEKFMKEKQRERLEISGSYWAYIKGFSIFLPYLVPRNDRKVQLSMAVMAFSILATRCINFLVPRQLGIVTDLIAQDPQNPPFLQVGIWLLLRAFRSLGLSMLDYIVRVPVEQFSYRAIQMASFNKIMSLDMSFHDDKDSGEVISAINQGRSVTRTILMLVQTLIPQCADIIIGFAYFYYLFDSTVMLILIITAVCYVAVDAKTTNMTKPARRKYADSRRAEYQTMNQGLSGWQTVSYFGREKYEADRFEKAIRAQQKDYWALIKYYWLSHATTEAVLQLAFFAASIVALVRISNGQAKIGSFVILLTYWNTVVGPLGNLADYYQSLSDDLIDAERLLVLLKTEPKVTEPVHAIQLPSPAKGNISVKDISFSYDPRKQTLNGISFAAEAGKTVAVVGQTGSGKSTLFKLLARFYDVTSGAITLDGHDLRTLSLTSLRDAIGVVPQDPALFNASILDNVRYARLDATDDQVHAACAAAAIHDKITSFPDGYASKVGERGVKLSGGELQRVAIARAILKGARVVLLDEATSAVDSETEGRIQEAFRALAAGRTILVIAHRLSTIVGADVILVMHEGCIVERGTHAELLAQPGGRYKNLWEMQVKATLEGVDSANKKAAEDKLIDLGDDGTEDAAQSSRHGSESTVAGGGEAGDDAGKGGDNEEGESGGETKESSQEQDETKKDA